MKKVLKIPKHSKQNMVKYLPYLVLFEYNSVCITHV